MGGAGRRADNATRVDTRNRVGCEAGALPTAGLTALRSLELGGLLLARRVLITGATGGVGSAVQLAALAGAVVTALWPATSESSTAALRRLGATRVIGAVDGEFDLIVDAVGGTTFAAAIEHVAPRGLVVNLATGTRTRSSRFAQRTSTGRRARGSTRQSAGRTTRREGAEDLARLALLVAQQRLVAPSSSRPRSRRSAVRSRLC